MGGLLPVCNLLILGSRVTMETYVFNNLSGSTKTLPDGCHFSQLATGGSKKMLPLISLKTKEWFC